MGYGGNKKLYLKNELITNLIIPDSVTSIDNSAFYNCSRLTRIFYKGTAEQWGELM